jgi:hypothetical protein
MQKDTTAPSIVFAQHAVNAYRAGITSYRFAGQVFFARPSMRGQVVEVAPPLALPNEVALLACVR